MTAKLFTIPKQVVFTNAGALIPGAKAYFYINGTSTPQDTFTTIALDTPHTNPVIADGEGLFPAIYLDDDLQYKVVLTDSNDVELYTEDNFLESQQVYPQTQAEDNASVTPTDYSYPPGDVRRYGAVGDGTTDDYPSISSAISTGHDLVFPDGGAYYIETGITFAADDLSVSFEDGAYIKPNSALLKPVTIGAAANPARMHITKLRVDRTTYSGATENYGIVFLECGQCVFINCESRFSKYNYAFEPSAGGHAYNTHIDAQGVGGFYNYWLDASASGYVNENWFIGGRGFCTSDTDTNLRIDAGGLGCGHNRFSMSLEGQGVQGIYDDGDANEFHQCRSEGTWSGGNFHVYGPNCQYPLVISSRIDYTLDRSAPSDPRDQVITYRNGTFLTTANNERTTLTLQSRSASNALALQMETSNATNSSYAWRAVNRAATAASGTHDGANDAAVLTDSGEAWTTSAFIGYVIYNTTDGSFGVVTANTATTITATLLDGTDNNWDTGDAYEVYSINGYLQASGNMKIRGGFAMHDVNPVAQAAHIANPSGGATQDAEARTAINSILTAIENIGITAKS